MHLMLGASACLTASPNLATSDAAVVDADGRVRRNPIRVLFASPADFAAAVREALAGARFHPGQIQRRPPISAPTTFHI
jgi:hypothetical protein